MSEHSSIRVRVLSRIVSALEDFSEDIEVDVHLEGTTLVVKAELARVINGGSSTEKVGSAPSGRGFDRPDEQWRPLPEPAKPAREPAESGEPLAEQNKKRKPRNERSKKSIVAGLPEDTPDRILAVLRKSGKGLNQRKLADAVNVKEKARLKPLLAVLRKKDFIVKIGSLYRSADVVVRAGRPRKNMGTGTTKPAKPPRKKPAREHAPEKMPASLAEKFSRDSVLKLLKENPKGFTKPKLAIELGAKKKSKRFLDPVIAELEKEKGERQVEVKAGKIRLKNLERKAGRRPKATEDQPKNKKGERKNAKRGTKAANTTKAQKAKGGKKGGASQKKRPPKRGNRDGSSKGGKSTSTERPGKPSKPSKQGRARKADKPKPAKTKSKNNPTVSERKKAARAKAEENLALIQKLNKKNAKAASEDEMDESGQVKRELTRTPIEEEEAPPAE